MLNTVNVKFNYTCDACGINVPRHFKIEVSTSGNTFNERGFEELEERAEQKRLSKRLNDWHVVLTPSGDYLDVCPRCFAERRPAGEVIL
jgi:hypothetical protein